MEDYPIAPDLEGVTEWLQSTPLNLKQLEGKVVGLEFWAVGCGNCQNAVPHMQKIYEKYGHKGFVLIGVHSPEFASEKNVDLIKKFLMHEHITFPVAIDNDHVVWNKYHNQYWPTLYLIDKRGRIRARHIGEGGYHSISHDIAILLKEN